MPRERLPLDPADEIEGARRRLRRRPCTSRAMTASRPGAGRVLVLAALLAGCGGRRDDAPDAVPPGDFDLRGALDAYGFTVQDGDAFGFGLAEAGVRWGVIG